MKVYVVLSGFVAYMDENSTEVEGVFSTREKASAFMVAKEKEMAKNPIKNEGIFRRECYDEEWVLDDTGDLKLTEEGETP